MNIFTIPRYRSINVGSRKKKEEDLREEIQRLINRINELKLELRKFVEHKGRKARESYPMLLEDMNDAARELKDVLDVLNKLVRQI